MRSFHMVNSMAVLALTQKETKCCVYIESPAQAYCTMMIGSEAQCPTHLGVDAQGPSAALVNSNGIL